MEKEFDYYKILKVDYAAYFDLWLTILPWLFFLMVFLPESKISIFYAATVVAIISLIGLILLVRRMRYLNNLYIQGVDVIGRIESTHAARIGGSTIEYNYAYQAENYHTFNELRTDIFYRYSFHENDEVLIRLNPKNPEEALIREVYFPIDENKDSQIVPKLSESPDKNKLVDRGLLIVPEDFVFANIWSSDRVVTETPQKQFFANVVGICSQKYHATKNKDNIILRKNLIIKINTAKLMEKNIFTFEIRRYYHRIYSVYYVFAVIMSFVIVQEIPGNLRTTRSVSLILLFLLLPLVVLRSIYESEIAIKTFKLPDYPKGVKIIYSDILDAVREKEKGIS